MKTKFRHIAVFTIIFLVIGTLSTGYASASSEPRIDYNSAISAVSAGSSYTAALSNDGSLWTWGFNYYGQLGNGTTTDSSVPIKLTSLSNIKAVDAGKNHVVALTKDGSVWTWGDNESGQLGNGTTTNSTTPVKVTGISGVVAVAAGAHHTVAVTTDGQVWAWGANWYGMLGNGTTTDSSTPVKVTGLSGVIHVDAGYHNTVAVTNDGSVWTWGFNASGQLGNGTKTDSYTPIKVSGLSGVVDVAAGADYIIAATNDGSVYAWGGNDWGQLGNGSYINSSTPVKATGLSGVVAVDASYFYTVALTNDGSVWIWGSYEWWLYSNGKKSTTPVKVPNLSCVSAVAAGYDNTVALTNSGQVFTWGYNRSGQLGNGSTTNSTTPVQVTSISSSNTPPTVTTLSATSITSTSATLNGTVNPNGSPTTYYFEYGPSITFGSVTPTFDAGSGFTDQTVTADITGLNPNYIYFFRLVAVNGVCTTYGAEQPFNTDFEDDTPTPTVTTNPATSITSTGAILNGTYDSGLDPQKFPNLDAMYFEYGTTTDYGKTINQLNLFLDAVVGVSSYITNLTPNTTYHFRLVMTDASTTYHGDDQTFTTTQDFGSLKVSISPEEAVTAGAAWRIDGGDWHDSDETVFNIAVGTHTVSFKDITGWTTPSNLPVTIQNEKTSTLTGAYTAIEKVSVLTPSSPNATVTAGEPAKLFGSSAASSITIEAGAVAKLINFPGSNTITIKGDSTNFKVSRSGAMVKFEGVDGTAAQGTVVQLPATKIEQTIIFNDVSAKLVIENNKVMFGTQTVTLTAEGITGGSANQQETFTNSLNMTFNLIPAGTFTMGSPDTELGRWSIETQHQVTLTNDYYMQTTEVTQGQWKAVMGSNPSYFQNCGDNCPVEKVSWDDIQTFITKLNVMGQGTYALPTEAQWEYAARAGSTTAFANGGITKTGCVYDANLDKMGWYCYNSGGKTHSAAGKSPNAWGLYDMHGNVWEWCQDWYGSYSTAAVTDPVGPGTGSYRVIRGGGWGNDASSCRSAGRGSINPSDGDFNLGFRLVCPQGHQ